MEDITPPTTLLQAVRYFSDLDICRGYLSHFRWPDGVSCPRDGCGSLYVQWIDTRKIWRCKQCKKQFTVKVGTVFEDSPIGLDKWLVALWAITSMKNGISSYELHRTLGVTQKTAWFMLHRLRKSMQCPSFQDRLVGEVEADETYVGGKPKNRPIHRRTGKRGTADKAAVMGMLQRGGDVRAMIVPDTKGPTLRKQVLDNVEQGANLYTDAWLSYRSLDVEYNHAFVDHTKQYVAGRVHTNGIENFWSLLKRGLRGTYIHVQPQHLHRYVDEQVYRFNTRKMVDSTRFSKALESVSGKRLTYRALIGKT